MTTSRKRDNAYWKGRLRKDGHAELLARVEDGELSMFKAMQQAGYRSKQPKSPAGKLSYHWQRASHAERVRFAKKHLTEINRVGRQALAEVRAQEDKKNSR